MLGHKNISGFMARVLFSLLVSIAPMTAFGQTTDFSKYEKLDSIKYKYVYGEKRYKYEYDEEGRLVKVFDDYKLENSDRWTRSGEYMYYWDNYYNRLNGYEIHTYDASARINFEYDESGKLLKEKSGYGDTEMVFDELGRFAKYSYFMSDYDYTRALFYERQISYFDNGRIRSVSSQITSMIEDRVVQSMIEEYNESGQIVKSEHMEAEAFWIKDDDDRSDYRYFRTLYYYDTDNNLTGLTEESKDVMLNPTDEFIERIGGQEEFDRWYNVWITKEYNCATDIKRNDAGKIISRKSYTLNPWSGERDRDVLTEGIAYDENGNETTRNISVEGVRSSITESHIYDSENRVVMFNLRYGNDDVYHVEYAYDEEGNQVITNNDFVYSPYTAFCPIKKEYDHKGNIISEEAPRGYPFRRSYYYKDGVLCEEWANLGNYKLEYTYDDDGNRTSVTAPDFKITYDTKVPSFRTGGFLDTERYQGYYFETFPRPAKPSSYNLVYIFDEPFKVKSYTKYENGQEINVELYYSPFVEAENAVNTVNQDTKNAEKYFDIQGRQLTTPRKGINIVRKSDGSSRKFIIK